MLRWQRKLLYHSTIRQARIGHRLHMPSCGAFMEASNGADSKPSDGPRGCCGANIEKKSSPTPHTLAAPEAAGSAPYKSTFYKRTLPTPPCIAFASDEGKQVCLEAMQAGHMHGFFKLIQHLSTQGEPAYCAIASLCVVLNAMEVDPRRVWKGAWRWFSEDMLDCCKPLDQVKQDGLTLEQVACLAKCNCSGATMHRSGTFTCEQFREDVAAVTSSGTEHIIVTYSRKTMSQTGDGHFSPIGGFHQGRDLVLILDTARFKYPPHWVPLQLLFEAMAPLDSTTGQPRGYLKLAPRDRFCLLLFKLSIHNEWQAAHEFAVSGCQGVAEDALAQGRPAQEIIEALVMEMPHESAACLVKPRDMSGACNPSMSHAQQQALHEMAQLQLYSIVDKVIQQLDLRSSPRSGSAVGSGPEQCTAASSLLLQQCFVVLCLCRPALERALERMVGLQKEEIEENQEGDVVVMNQVLELLAGVKQSSLVSNEILFLTEQLGRLHILDGTVDTTTSSLRHCGCRA